MKNKNTIDKNQIFWLIFISFISLFFAFMALGVFHRDITVPFWFEGDTTGGLMEVKNLMSGNWLYYNRNIAAPFGSEQAPLMKGYWIHAVIIKVITFFIKDVGTAINVFFLLGFPLTSITAYLCLRKLNINNIISLVLGIIYCFIPYHFQRGETHIYLSQFYLIPLACIVILYTFEGKVTNVTCKDFFDSLKSRRFILSVLICILLGFSDIYYATFFLMILGIASVYSSLNNKNIFNFIYGIILMLCVIVPLIIILIPVFFAASESQIFTNRSVQDLVPFSLKMLQMLLPIPGHRLPLFSKIREIYDASLPYVSWKYMTSLGLVMSAGFIISLICLFFDEKTKNNGLKNLGKLNLIILLLGCTGGIGEFIGVYFFSYIRAYNRLCIFIAVFSLATIGMILQKFYNQLRGKNTFLFYSFCVLLMSLGVLDQTSADYASKTDYNPFDRVYTYEISELEKMVNRDKQFVKEIENVVEDGALIMQLPIISHEKFNLFPNGKVGGLELIKPYYYSSLDKDLRWSAGDIYGGRTDDWLTFIKQLDTKQMLKIISFSGFSGIYIDSRGYDDIQLQALLQELGSILDTKPITTEDDQLYFYDMNPYISKLRGKYTKEEWAILQESSLDIDRDVVVIEEKNMKSDNESALFFSGESILHSNAVQYGPYIHLDEGRYTIRVLGEDLNYGTVDCAYSIGNKLIPLKLTSHKPSEITYEIKLEKALDNVEFRLHNDSKYDISFKKMLILGDDVAYTYFYNSPGMSYIGNYKEKTAILLKKKDRVISDEFKLDSGVYQLALLGENLEDVNLELLSEHKDKVSIELIKGRSNILLFKIIVNDSSAGMQCLIKNDTKKEQMKHASVSKIYISKGQEYGEDNELLKILCNIDR